MIDAEKATFLVGSDIPGIMTGNSKVAYGSVEAATDARKHHGGQLMNFQDTMKVAFADLAEDMEGMRRAREERRKRAARKKAG